MFWFIAHGEAVYTDTYETKDERSMGIFFSDEREASDPKPHPATRLPSLPPRPITPAQPDASPDDLAATDMRRGQALAVIYDTIQEGEWTKELKRAFKAIGLALGVDAYAAYPETFERPSARTRNEGECLSVDVFLRALIGTVVAKGKVDIHAGDIKGPVADKEVPAPAPPTEKARGKKRAEMMVKQTLLNLKSLCKAVACAERRIPHLLPHLLPPFLPPLLNCTPPRQSRPPLFLSLPPPPLIPPPLNQGLVNKRMNRPSQSLQAFGVARAGRNP